MFEPLEVSRNRRLNGLAPVRIAGVPDESVHTPQGLAVEGDGHLGLGHDETSKYEDISYPEHDPEELAMIGQTLSRISKMEQEQRIQEIQSSRRINQRWVDTLGGVYRYRHPHASVEGTIPAGKIPSGPTRWRAIDHPGRSEAAKHEEAAVESCRVP